MSRLIVIDGAGAILGRLASHAAKQSLLGKEVVIVNCDKVVIAGNRENIVEEWSNATRRGGHSLKGPFVPRKNTEKMVKRTIRGMLSYKQARGLAAWKRIRCYPLVPAEYGTTKKITLLRPVKNQIVQLAELSKVI
jgi:large subunit ribosomal protein L13